jgi:AcrR family transcriptional regulator
MAQCSARSWALPLRHRDASVTAAVDLGVGGDGSAGLAGGGAELAQQAQAAQARQDILDAAHQLFVEHGYAGTTLAAIAQAAGVVVETIYRAYGSKAVVRAAVAGGTARAEVPVEQRPAIQAVIAETDPHRQLELYAATQPGIHARAGPLLRVLVGAAAADAELTQVWTQLENERLAGMGRFAQLLADRGVLRTGLSVEEARDLLWTLNALAVHDLLVVHRQWSPERYRDWLAATLARTLLPDRQPPKRPPRPRSP